MNVVASLYAATIIVGAISSGHGTYYIYHIYNNYFLLIYKFLFFINLINIK